VTALVGGCQDRQAGGSGGSGHGQLGGAVLVGQGLAGGQVAAATMYAGAWGHGGAGQVQALDRGAPAPPVQPRVEQQLLVDGERSAVDVAGGRVGTWL
jgi:hypothetical protein